MRRGRGTVMVLSLVLLVVGLTALSTAAGASPGKRKCSSFASQKAAQKYFVGHGGSQSNDAAGLDPDGDGLACPDNPGPFAAYVELAFAHGFFYGQVVCVDWPEHLTKAEVRAEEKNAEEAAGSHSKFRGRDCASPFVEVQLKEVTAGKDPVVASHNAEAGGEPTRLPIGASERNQKGSVLSFEFKLEPKKSKGKFYAFSEECFGTPSRRVQGA
ncbi:MAG: hypothetical protein BGO11_17325 [Solirubrobacterales bacterium 70-9]|nr:MAG: hypothetical protein BGO11_17325 [Solirubrobacterales bacterium 70-9]